MTELDDSPMTEREERARRDTAATPATHHELYSTAASLRRDIDESSAASTIALADMTKAFMGEIGSLRQEVTKLRQTMVVVSVVSVTLVALLAAGLWSISGDRVTRDEVLRLIEIAR